jgi:hypothetical protein
MPTQTHYRLASAERQADDLSGGGGHFHRSFTRRSLARVAVSRDWTKPEKVVRARIFFGPDASLEDRSGLFSWPAMSSADSDEGGQ